MKKKIHLSSDDFTRVLITDTQPYHIPLIFNNYGFYKTIKKLDDDLYKCMPQPMKQIFQDNDYTIPFMFHISKGSHSHRLLGLIHPLHQLKFVDFYKKFYTIILYHCNHSEFSLRYPKKINSTVYRIKYEHLYNELGDTSAFKTDHKTTDIYKEDENLEFASSFFAYNKFDFNYKFYDSIYFLSLEKKFTFLKILDIAKCFDSIYTHSISWAIKGKPYIKNNLNIKNINNTESFEDTFDNIMQYMNYRETNGIIIGAEFSRIFAELIFQRIDSNIEKKLKQQYNLKHNKDYAIRRYVDDYYIFYSKEDDVVKILEVLIESLKEYNLSLNPSKTKDFKRPFITPRSRNIVEIRKYFTAEMDKILVKEKTEDGKKYYLPNAYYLRNPIHRATNFIQNIKSHWYNNGNFETGFSGYLLKSLMTQLLKILKYYKNIPNIQEKQNSIINFFLFVLEISTYCFILEPNVTQSISFSKIIIFIDNFISKNMINYKEKFRHIAKKNIMMLLNNEHQYMLVERLNILLTLNQILGNSTLDSEKIKLYLFNKDEYNYFSLIVGLFICKNEPKYQTLKYIILDKIEELILELGEIKYSSELFHLYFDCISCPYVPKNIKIKITKKLLLNNGISKENINIKTQECVNFINQHEWFVTWNSIDFLNYLRRKQLREAY